MNTSAQPAEGAGGSRSRAAGELTLGLLSGEKRGCTPICFCSALLSSVGASLLAMDVNDDAGCLNARGVLAFFASKLAPTGGNAFICGQVGCQAVSLLLLILF